MRRLAAMLILSSALFTPRAWSQEAEEARLEAAMAAAQAAAIHPGDEALTCDQLQAEMTASMSDPEVQARMAAMGEQGQAMQEQSQAAGNRARAQMAGSMAMGVASMFVPGLGYAQMLTQRAQAAQMQSQTEANQAQMAEMSANLEAVMPQIMRGQRLYELAQAQQCPFLQQMQAPQ